MIRITVSQSAEAISYTDKTSGEIRKFYKQWAYAHCVNEKNETALYPDKFSFLLPRGVEHGPAPGDYTLHPSALAVEMLKGARDPQLVIHPDRLAPVKARTPA